MSTARGRGRVAVAARPLAALAIVVAGGVASAVGVVAPPSALATPTAGACIGDSGVTVVVDFGTLGGGTVTRCAPEPVSSGFDALTRAGFTYAGTARYPGLLCRIDEKPTPQQDACQNAPSPTYYWAYWTASSPGGAWTYSDKGAGNRDPAPGSVEGWAFSDGCTRQPGGSCGAGRTTTTTTTTASRSASPPAASAGSTSAPTTSAPVADAGAAGATATTAPGATTTTSTTASVTGGPRPTRDDTDDTAAALPSQRGDGPRNRDGSGSPVGLLVGAGMAAALGLGALVHQRRRSEPDSTGAAEAGEP